MSARVLLATADLPVLEHLESALGEVGGYEVVGRATSSQQVHDRLAAGGVDVLVLDQDLGPVPALDLARQVTRAHPFVAALMLARADDPETLRLGMEAGVRGFLTLPLAMEEVAQRLDNAAGWAATVRRHVSGETAPATGGGRLITVSGSKGGVGTTTAAIRLALEAASAGRRTVLVDLDLVTGDVGTYLDVTHRRDVTDLVVISDEISGRALTDCLYRYDEHLHVLLAPRDPERGEEVHERLARNLLGAATSHFDVVVVDAGSVPTAATAAAVEMADEALVVVTPDVASVRGGRRLLRLWESLSVRKPDDARLVLNRASKRAEIQPELARKLVKAPMATTTLPAAFAALEPAVNTGDPARVTDPALRRAWAELAVEVGAVAAPAADRGRKERCRRDAGQVAVEFLGMFFLVAVVVLALGQTVMIGYAQSAATHAAGEAARTAVSPEHGYHDIRTSAVDALPRMLRDDVEVTVAGRRDFADEDPRYSDPDAPVHVATRAPALVPLLDRVFDDLLDVSATTQARFEGSR